MADILLVGHVVGVRYGKSWVSVKLAERRAGYTRKDGVKVQSDVVYFRILFKPYIRPFMQAHIPSGSLVKVKGTIVPYVVGEGDEGDEGVRESFTIFGQTIDMFPYPSRSILQDKQALKVCPDGDTSEPDLENFYNDF